jgi:exonuclease I
VYDFETTGRDPHSCQITQIAAIALHSRKLTVEPNGIFNSELRPIMDDEEAIAAGYSPIEEKALEVTRKTREGLAAAPDTKLVWESFVSWVNRFNYRKSSFTAPIPCGYNINGFDSHILKRYCQKYGPVSSEGRQNLFNDVWKLDLMDMVFGWTESNAEMKSRKLVNIMDWLGFPAEAKANAHDALCDVKNTANILIKLLSFQREVAKSTNFGSAFSSKSMYIN